MHIHASTRAIVTGASKGIGRALAEALAARGATVGLAARSAEELAALAEALGPHAIALPCDVGSAEELGAAVERFVAQAGGLDLAIANAGIAHYGRFEDQDPELHERMTRVNWLGTANTARAALPHLRAGGGHLVIVSSGAGLRAFPEAAVYGATKAAQRAFAEALRHELAGTGVSVTTVYPGEIASSLHDHEKATMPDWYHGDSQAATGFGARRGRARGGRGGPAQRGVPAGGAAAGVERGRARVGGSAAPAAAWAVGRSAALTNCGWVGR